LRNGSALFVKVQVPENSVTVKKSPDSTVSVPSDALAILDTGDVNWHTATDKARHISGKPISLLVQGEKGVGKSIFAQAAHDSSPRRDGPYVKLNCSTVPENRIEAELFGYAPGAFIGAKSEGSIGKLREADGGTLFLDEIGELPLSMQTRLLHALQERKVTPPGGGQAVDVDFALICATSRKLRDEADKGIFNSDLYYRINGLTINLPALRERNDFQAITEQLLAELNPGRDLYLAPDLLAQLSRHSWPGNVQQYLSVLRTASAMLNPDEDQINWKHLPDDLVEELTAIPTQPAVPITHAAPQNLEELSRSAIKQALESCHGNISEAARRLGISRQTLYRKLNT
jgi:transcriptional regulator with PAS, ATPase and Fis domain